MTTTVPSSSPADQRRSLLPWWDLVDWPNDPQLAFARGLAIGIEIGADTYARAAAAATRDARRAVAMVDARAAADNPRQVAA
jgi:hypothetical protein